MKMWIGCLAAYNCGCLHGRWCDVSEDADDNAAAIAKVLASSPAAGAEEYLVADYEAPRAIADTLGEYPSAQNLADAARLESALERQWPDADDRDAVLKVMLDGQSARDFAELADGAEDWISERYAGEGDSLVEWCANFLDETCFFDGVRDDIQRYFDFEAYSRDLQLGGDITCERSNGRVLVFWDR